MCHVTPIQPLEVWQVEEDVCGVVAELTGWVGAVGGVREREVLQRLQGKYRNDIL